MVIALILSGGTGSRLGADIPKQYLRVQGRPVLLYCMETLHKSPVIDAVQIVAAQEWIGSWLEVYGLAGKFRGFSLPGENRQLSIFHGLTDIRQYAEEDDLVLIHDAARPLLSQKLIADCEGAIRGHDGVLPVLPMKDTVYYSKDGRQITSLLDRQAVFAGQAPELFRLGTYYQANERLLPEEILRINGSTEPAVLAGMQIAMVPGDERNFKITTPADLERFRQIVENEA